MTGGDGEDRTPDLCNANATLSQLSYAPIVSTFYHNKNRQIQTVVLINQQIGFGLIIGLLFAIYKNSLVENNKNNINIKGEQGNEKE